MTAFAWANLETWSQQKTLCSWLWKINSTRKQRMMAALLPFQSVSPSQSLNLAAHEPGTGRAMSHILSPLPSHLPTSPLVYLLYDILQGTGIKDTSSCAGLLKLFKFSSHVPQCIQATEIEYVIKWNRKNAF